MRKRQYKKRNDTRNLLQDGIKTDTYLDNSEAKELSQNQSLSKESVVMFRVDSQLKANAELYDQINYK